MRTVVGPGMLFWKYLERKVCGYPDQRAPAVATCGRVGGGTPNHPAVFF